MNMTATAAELLEPIPAHRTFGLRVLSAEDGAGVVSLHVRAELTNVIGTLHSSGLIALADATGLAAIIGAADSPAEFAGITPLGTAAELEFLRPAAGELTGHCTLDRPARVALRRLLDRDAHKATLSTDTEIADDAGTIVAHGSFTWKLRRAPAG